MYTALKCNRPNWFASGQLGFLFVILSFFLLSKYLFHLQGPQAYGFNTYHVQTKVIYIYNFYPTYVWSNDMPTARMTTTTDVSHEQNS